MRNQFTAAAIARDISSPDAQTTAPKVLLYSHDTFGLGNIRRTLLLAESLADAYPAASLLIVTGSPMIHAFRIPPRTDYIKLPCVTRPAADSYAPAYLDSRGPEVAEIRGGVLERAILGFAPDLGFVRPGAADGLPVASPMFDHGYSASFRIGLVAFILAGKDVNFRIEAPGPRAVAVSRDHMKQRFAAAGGRVAPRKS